jgi:tetratricopeptide (TPR) repeat protein
VWKNDKTLLLTDVKVSKNSIKCNVSAGGMSMEMAKAEPDTLKKIPLVNQGFAYLEKAQQLHPWNYFAWFLMGSGYVELRDWKHALPYFEEANRINPENKDAYKSILFIAQITSKVQQYQTSVDAYQFLSEIDPGNDEHRLLAADGLSHIGMADSSLRIIDRVLMKNDKNAMAWSKKGEIFGRVMKDLTNAEIFLKKSIELNPNDLSANENLGIVYGIKRQFELSILYFNKAVSIDSTQARIYQNLAGTYSAMGNKTKVKECLNKAMQYAQK